MSTVAQIMDALATQVETYYSGGTATPIVDNLQVDGRLIPSPTPPAIDIYPADPFQERMAMGHANNELFFTVRARVNTADNEAGQDLLLSFMDPEATSSMIEALLVSRTLGGTVERVTVEGPSSFGLFGDPGGQMSLLGCTWRARVIP